MSGPICPTCSGFDIETEGLKSRCRTCGWAGDILPNVNMPVQGWQRVAKEQDQWKRGVRKVLLVTLDPSALDAVKKELEGEPVVRVFGDPPRVTVELGEVDHKPIMQRLIGIDGVTRVETE